MKNYIPGFSVGFRGSYAILIPKLPDGQVNLRKSREPRCLTWQPMSANPVVDENDRWPEPRQCSQITSTIQTSGPSTPTFSRDRSPDLTLDSVQSTIRRLAGY